ncbi:Histidine kinase [Filimonas lacunae]|uniref:Histidine kinase n=1 Tax=Filimonas lacunae TaxID=477680 RepID=A0A173M9N5_9BACT|nr:histidine kinase [Filimonas lacunae]BAV04245.1 two-component system sensor protein histidine kinase [Filimonas lacunae]SIT13642.1 Histidine kinase [Filimonas lacunae]
MKLPSEKKITLYGALAIALMVNIPRLSALRTGAVMAQYAMVNPFELVFQIGFNFLFCYLVFLYNMQGQNAFKLRLGQNVLILLTGVIVGAYIQRHVFNPHIIRQFYRVTYLARFFTCMVVELLVVRILYLVRETRARELEAEQAKTRFVKAELALLKQQLNPHFFFNSLSTLAGIVREDPAKAQRFIGHLSKIFRGLLQHNESVITVREELKELEAYTALLKMRFENSIDIDIEVPENYLHKTLPHLSIQPLIENAAKHNKATAAMPLHIHVKAYNGCIYVQNNLQPVGFVQEQSGTGLVNLSERFRLLMGTEISITRTDQHFIVSLPLN